MKDSWPRFIVEKFILAFSIFQMPEEEAFCVFVRLMQEYRLRELFKPSMAELGLCIYQFEYLLQVKRCRPIEIICASLAVNRFSTRGQQRVSIHW